MVFINVMYSLLIQMLRVILFNRHLLDASGIPVLEEYTGTVTTTIFVYGHKVTDFHTIKNDSIFTIAAAASQEIDRQLQESKSVIVFTSNYYQRFEIATYNKRPTNYIH